MLNAGLQKGMNSQGAPNQWLTPALGLILFPIAKVQQTADNNVRNRHTQESTKHRGREGDNE